MAYAQDLGSVASRPGGQPSSASAEDAAEIVSQTYSVLYGLNWALSQTGAPLPTPPIPSPLGALGPTPQTLRPQDTVTWNCTGVNVSGDASDPDSDGVPANATYNARCTYAYTGGGGSASWTWEMRNLNVQDPNNSDPYAGWRIRGQILWTVSAGGETGNLTWTINAADVVKTARGSYNLTHRSSLDVSAGGESGQLQYDFTGTWTADPGQPEGLPFAVNGTLTEEGSITLTANGESFSVPFSGNLHYSTQCGGYDSGTFTLTISTPDGTLTCRATITGCRSSSGSCTE